MRRSILARFTLLATGSIGLVAAIPPAAAQEALDAREQAPLLLRIRPPGEAPRHLGAGSGPMTDEEVRQARARNEAVWARADQRARIAIASVCTGCLAPVRPPAAPPSSTPVEATPAPVAAAPATSSPFAQTGAP